MVSHGCVKLPGDRVLLSSEDFSDADYAVACHNAAPSIQEDLQLLDPATVTRAGRLADFSTKPLGVTSPAMEKWITRSWSVSERRDILSTALQEKARGAFDFIVAFHDPIYRLVRNLASESRGAKKQFSLAMLLDVVFRVAINGQLAKLRRCTYAPAPQRANVTHETDHLFRHALERMIQETASDGQQKATSELIRRIIAVERLPLPMLAIHFLGTRKTSSPLGVLDVARDLRDTPDVVWLRKWLSKWESIYNSSDLDSQERAAREIADFRDSLRALDERTSLFSVLRPEVTSSPDGSMGMSFDLTGFSTPVAKLFAKLSRRRVFLAALKREVLSDQELGARICGFMGRPFLAR